MNFKQILAVAILVAGSYGFILAQCTNNCQVSAGSNVLTCCGCVTIGGNPTASCTPGAICNGCTYAWSPSTGLSCTTCANPCANPGLNNVITYTLTVTFPGSCCCSGATGNCTPRNPCSTVQHISTVTVTGGPYNCCFRLEKPEQLKEVVSENINLYPNPTTGDFTLSFSKIQNNTSVHIYDMEGQEVWSNENVDASKQSFIIDLSNKAKGTYFVQVKNNDNVSFFKKVIIQ